jgi:hypothetical protein
MWYCCTSAQNVDQAKEQSIDALQKQIKWIEDHSHGNAKADANIRAKSRTCRSIRKKFNFCAQMSDFCLLNIMCFRFLALPVYLYAALCTMQGNALIALFN